MPRENYHIVNSQLSNKVLYDQFIMQWFFSVVFIVFMFLPLFMNLFLPFHIDLENTEKRVYALKPELKFSNLSSFPQAFEAYYNDQFSLRNVLIRWNNLILVKFLNVSPIISKALIGKKGWFFYTGEGALDNYRNVILFSEEELENIKRTVEKRSAWLKKRGISYYLVFVPEKQSLYPEFMPDFIKPVGNTSKFDQVIRYLRKNSSIKLIDAKEVLFPEKKKVYLYSQLDSHWNQYGGFITSQSLLLMIAKDFPLIASFIPRMDDFNVATEIVRYGDIIDMLALRNSIFSEKSFTFTLKDKNKMPEFHNVDFQKPMEKICVVAETKNAQLPRMLMFRDSCATKLIPFLSHCFSRSVYIWTRSFILVIILFEKPNIVIDEIGERNIHFLITPPN